MVLESVHLLVRAIEVGGITIVVLGALLATVGFVARLRRGGFELADTAYRLNHGRAILLGLEVLVAADIIRTVAVDPTFGNAGVLAIIVAIRTFLSFSLEVELEGRWPWQPREPPRRSELEQRDDGHVARASR